MRNAAGARPPERIAPRLIAALVAFTLALAAAGCGDDGDGEARRAAASGDVWVVGDGGVAQPDDDRLAQMIESRGAGRFVYLGDVYETGTATEFREHYDRAFGRFKPITHPIPGNHEWPNRGAGYDRYWSDLMRRNGGRHYYSFDVGRWHFVALNTEEPVGPGSPQFAWLERDLAGRRDNCTIAVSHSPRYTLGLHGYDESLAPVWEALSGKAVALMSGHDHNYQRLKPEDGITQFVIGSGGRARYDVDDDHWRLADSDDQHFGALRLRLSAGRADYAFITADGRQEDAGSLTCSPAR